MMKIVAGAQKPTRGKVNCPKDTVIAYLPQHLLTEDNCTVFDEASKAFSHIFKMRDEMETLNKALETRTDYESDEYMSIIEKVSELGERYYALEDINYDAEVEKALKGLGFKQADFTRLTSEFSGGWRMRIELAKILLQKPDLILLDEPTNHLDIKSKNVLKDALQRFEGTLILVSHDRDFLQGLTSTIYEFKDQQVKEYLGDIDYYLEQRKVENLREVEKRTVVKATPKESNKQSYEEQKKLKSLNNKLSNVESKINQLEKEIKEIDVELATNYDEVVSDPKFFDNYQAKKDKLAQLMEDWEEITIQIEDFS